MAWSFSYIWKEWYPFCVSERKCPFIQFIHLHFVHELPCWHQWNLGGGSEEKHGSTVSALRFLQCNVPSLAEVWFIHLFLILGSISAHKKVCFPGYHFTLWISFFADWWPYITWKYFWKGTMSYCQIIPYHF